MFGQENCISRKECGLRSTGIRRQYYADPTGYLVVEYLQYVYISVSERCKE